MPLILMWWYMVICGAYRRLVRDMGRSGGIPCHTIGLGIRRARDDERGRESIYCSAYIPIKNF